MSLDKRGGKTVVCCDKCGDIISWKITPAVEHGYTCTNCIDKDYGKYRVVDIFEEEIKEYTKDKKVLPKKDIKYVIDTVRSGIMFDNLYYSLIKKALEDLGYETSKDLNWV
jgi:hypothetical protein